MNLIPNGNWGLKLLALALAIVLYYALKNESYLNKGGDDRTRQQERATSQQEQR